MIIHGDCLDEMKKMEDNSISGIVCDPPYGLHFMGKDWDSFKYAYKPGYNKPGEPRKSVVSETNSSYCAGTYDPKRDDEFQSFIYQFGIEALRILKPGGHILMFGAPRRYHRQVSGLEDAGFEIRDCLMWLFGSGFPKSHNHFGCEGYGTALKPAYEPIIMAMKPCDGTFKQNAEKWGQAGINIDGCRIGTEEMLSIGSSSKGLYEGGFGNGVSKSQHPKGRWPANVIFDEESSAHLDKMTGFEASRFFYCAKTSSRERNEGLEVLEDKGIDPSHFATPRLNDLRMENEQQRLPKKNNHPTVKPLKLMRYLITLIMPPKDGILLDPFAGSGSTIIAAHQLGVKAIGIEKQPEYVEIATKRLEYYKNFKDDKEPDLFDKAINQ